MGNKSCMGSHNDMGAVGGSKLGQGGDIDAAVLAAASMASEVPKQRLSLSFACKDLPNMDTFSYSDPFLILYKKHGSQWQKLGQTEVIHDNLNPQWVTKINVDYHFEQADQYKLEVWDVDNDDKVNDLKQQEFCGGIEFQLHEVVTCIDQIMTKKLVNSKMSIKASVIITAEEMANDSNREIVKFNPIAKLKESSSLYFFIIYKMVSPGKFVPVYKSETRKPVGGEMKWNMVQIGTTDLCKDDIERTIKMEFFRSVPSGKHVNLGACEQMTLGTLRGGQDEYDITKNGKLRLTNLKVERHHSFLEYVFGGCEVDLSIAIDFTLSNGNPKSRESLHYFDPQRNQYLQVLQSVGSILQFYNTDKFINLYGFGGAVPPYHKRPSHCFALNGDILAPRVNGLDQVIHYYREAINKCDLYGPTHFGSILNQVNSHIEADPGNYQNQKFHILLIITDGIINDMRQSIDEIVRGSSSPLAIIIVGVGDADFSNMETLDGDDEALWSSRFNKYCEADIVQFVPFNEFKHNPSLLAKETLMELPGQLLNYMRKRNIEPLPRTEMQRRQLQQQLSMREASAPGTIPRYFMQEKERILQKAQEMGIDLFAAQDVIENKRIWENNMELILDYMSNPNMMNRLAMAPPQMQMQMPPMMQGQQPMTQGMPMNNMMNAMAGQINNQFQAQYAQMGQPPMGQPMGQQPMMGQTPMMGGQPMPPQGQQPMQTQGQPQGGYAYFDPSKGQ